MNRSLLLAVGFAAACSIGISNAVAFEEEPEPEPEVAVEKVVPPPPFPAESSLLGFDAGAASGNRFFVDRESISVGEDGIVRFVLVIRTPGGAENVSFEGIRCETLERKLYATGRRDRTWSKSRNQNWQPISESTLSLPHMALARRYFCEFGLPITSPRKGVEALLRGGPAGIYGQ